MLGPADPLPHVPRRVLVAGNTGAGKSTLSRRISDVLGLRYVELDALYHGPQWTPRPSFEADVLAFTSGPRWVTEWQYKQVRPLLLERADTLVWLDHTLLAVMRRLLMRTVRRRAARAELWNGNSEPPLWTVFTDPEHLLRWGWKGYGRNRRRVRAVQERIVVVRLRGQRQVEKWLSGPLSVVAGEERAR
ncbi:adenylate kinase [Lentzea sp. NBRC 105346]|uniref:AAA family ATPase n=1 Tax=Lentzea sp. NBRC 105346 TaxID=3032205 RepID=UPI0024A3F910|nr:AAA family ATPase [Lentzea sp. NBRC 105346]GLZ29489.1 adenylate kinase [Lentzea sp. NBRC 105346]